MTMRTQTVCRAAIVIAVLPVAAYAQGEIKPVQSKPVAPYVAKEIQPVKAKEIQPYTPKTIDGTRQPLPKVAPDAGKAASPSAFVGTWQLAVEGASSTTDNYATNTRTITSSSGALGRRLVIRTDDSYDWGGTKGRWAATGEGAGGYPLVLLKADHGHDWKVRWDTRRNAPAGRILVWDGYIWEIGTAAK